VDERYDFVAIETKWQRRWAEAELFRVDESAPRDRKFYYLDMFPYPSGKMHMGHVRNYIIGDVIARYYRMKGYNVLHPMGWDAFGLPAENAAIKRKVHPADWTRQCINEMRQQFDRLGISFDWSREVTTCSPDYYKWTEWMFLQLFKAGLAYKKEAPVNWCPGCQTVLANEQVVNGRCERCDSEVEKKQLAQWFFRTTAYAERLLADLDKLSEWPERVKTMQRAWIGKSTGEDLPVFTTRVDTIFGATYVVMAAEHPLALEVTVPEKKAAAEEFIRQVKAKTEIERTAAGREKFGFFTGSYAINPVNGEQIPLYLADYVLMDYGTGAIMAVPAHDERDFAFAKKYNLPIRVVIQPEGQTLRAEDLTEAYVEDGVQVNSGPFDGLPNRVAMERIADWMEAEGIGRRQINYRLRDWCVSRQRYWGAPIPIIYCPKCGVVPVPEEDLPVLLPENVEFTGEGGSPLARCEEFVNTTCPQCGGPAKRETDTQDTFVCSSWYFLRYADPANAERPFDRSKVDYWLPVDQYVGGIEHATMHLLYARFFTKALYDLGYVGFEEPFTRLFTQGMIYKDGAKMSKSKGNVVTPEAIQARYGADTGRLYILFVGPADQDAEWNDAGVEGVFRFLKRLWRTYAKHVPSFDKDWRSKLAQTDFSEAQLAIRRKLHQTLAKVEEDLQRFHFNTSVAALMELLNVFQPWADALESPAASDVVVISEVLEQFARLLSVFVPHLADELWEQLGFEGFLLQEPFPTADESLLVEETVELPVQINGKVRGRISAPVDADAETLKALVLADEKLKSRFEGKTIVKFFARPGQIISFVVK